LASVAVSPYDYYSYGTYIQTQHRRGKRIRPIESCLVALSFVSITENAFYVFISPINVRATTVSCLLYRLSTLSVPGGRGRPRSNTSTTTTTQSSDDCRSRDGHLSSRDSINDDDVDEHAPTETDVR